MAGSDPVQPVVLIVDDDANDIMLMKRALGKAIPNYIIQSVSSGTEAIGYLHGDPPFQNRNRHPFPKLVLLDIKLPLIDGFEVLRWIRSQAEFTSLHVVMLTGSDAIKDADAAYHLGATSFFVKPFDFANAIDLAQTLERITRKTQ